MTTQSSEHKRQRRGLTPLRGVLVVVVLVLLVVAGAAALQLGRITPGASAQVVLASDLTVVPPAGAAPLPLPASGEAAVAIEGLGELGGVRADRAVPLASITKLVTALVVLRAHPVRLGHHGPVLTVTRAQVRAYQAGLRTKDSEVAVRAGERITERELLEGMLIPSGDDMADILGQWVAPNRAALTTQLNAEASRLGLRDTHLVGASGLSPASVGSAADLVRLGAAVLATPLLRHIVALPQVTLPVAGLLYNYNYAVGHDGIIGIKTGSTTAAGGNFLFAAEHSVDGHLLVAIGAVLGQGGATPLQAALDAGERLAAGAFAEVGTRTVVAAGTDVVDIRAPWGQDVSGRTSQAVSVLAAPGEAIRTRLVEAPALFAARVQSIAVGERLGTLVVTVGSEQLSVPVLAAGSMTPPSVSWRLTRT